MKYFVYIYNKLEHLLRNLINRSQRKKNIVHITNKSQYKNVVHIKQIIDISLKKIFCPNNNNISIF